ncbi:MAG: ABC transporter permease subunit [Chloroflexi bacterium]|nr:ABC transporter permease subunit [Chloroflexota bacterium]
MDSPAITDLAVRAVSHSDSAAQPREHLRIAGILLLARREVGSVVRGPGIYVILTLASLVAAVVVRSYLDFIAGSGTLVLADPLGSPLLFAVLTITGYLGLVAAAGLAGERERGTLEVLFYGPVDAASFVTGKLVGYLCVYVLMAAALVGFMMLTAALTGIPLGGRTLLVLAASLLTAGSMIALGLLLGALTGRSRVALALTGLVIAFFAAIEVGNRVAGSQPADSLLGSAAGLLAMASEFIGWVSPFSYLWRAQDSLALGQTIDVLVALIGTVVYGLVSAGLAILVLRRRGIQKWRE